MKKMMGSLALALFVAAGCGDSGGNGGSGGSAGAGGTGGMAGSGGSGGSGGTAGTGVTAGTGGSGGAGTVALTVKNYLAWCSVTVGSNPASAAAEQTVEVAPGTVTLSAVALSGFQLGSTPWHDTAGDSGSGDPGTVTGTGQSASSATTVVVGSSAKCVWVCCEFTGGGGCPTADQCP
ncbi:MAG: hypothetical protein WCF10_09435 [Polyangiales bacterium]